MSAVGWGERIKEKPVLQAARIGLAVVGLAAVVACQPTVRVEPPKEPITINLNVKSNPIT